SMPVRRVDCVSPKGNPARFAQPVATYDGNDASRGGPAKRGVDAGRRARCQSPAELWGDDQLPHGADDTNPFRAMTVSDGSLMNDHYPDLWDDMTQDRASAPLAEALSL